MSIILSEPVTEAVAGQTYRYDLLAADGDGDGLSYELTAAPEGIAIDTLGRIRWQPTAEHEGVVSISVTVLDEGGALATQEYDLTVLVDDLAPSLELFPSIAPAGIGEEVSIYVSATDNQRVESLSLTVDGVPVPLDIFGTYSFSREFAGIVPLVARATDAAGNVGEASIDLEVLDFSDTTGPMVDLLELPEGLITAPVEIVGTVDDSNLSSYQLLAAPLGTEDFVEVFAGTESVVDGVLGEFDPTLLANDSYTLRLTATDAGGNSTFIESVADVGGDLKLGNFQLSFTDLSVPVAGIPINVTRTYDSLIASTQDNFGYGWRLEFRDSNLRTSVGTDETFETFDITSKGFREGDKVYIPHSALRAVIRSTECGIYSISHTCEVQSFRF